MEKSWREESLKKRVNPNELETLSEQLKEKGLTIATLNGSFDLLHAGHLYMIYEAARQADRLIVCLNSDDSIKRYKSSERPIVPLENRLQMMSALAFVDYVTWFDETDPIKILEKIKPDVHVNGSEYGKQCIEKETVEKQGGRLHIVKLVKGLSTSEIIKKCKACAS